MNCKLRKIPLALSLIFCTALGSSGLAYGNGRDNEDTPGFAEETSQYVRDYLSDPRRVGALAGSILGSALTAHPAGSVVGSLIGFFVGKQSMFNEDAKAETLRSVAEARRPIIPVGGGETTIPALSFSNPQTVTFEDQPVQASTSLSPLPSLAATPASPPVQTQAVSPSLNIAPARAGGDQVVMAAPSSRPEPLQAMPAVAAPTLARPALPVERVPEAPVITMRDEGVKYDTAQAGLSAPPAAPVVTPPAVPMMIAAICSGGVRAVDARLKSLCFYNQSE